MAQPRPQFHFTPAFGWMNDPNGLVWHKGEYHLFYQYHPFSLSWGPMHWGHAVSRDLATWDHLPIALAPDEWGTIFSGSAVWDGDNTSGLVPGGGLVAVFSYHTQAQGVAFSTDGGRAWSKYEGNPVIPSPGTDFRDPKVFRHQGAWSMVLAAGDHLEFFRSSDLKSWVQTGRFDAALEVGVWECPDLFPLTTSGGERWVLLLSVAEGAPAGGSGTMYWVGDFDGDQFCPTTGSTWLDEGTDNYAGVTWNHAPGGERLFVGWMNNWRYGREIPAQGWRGAMTVPRRLCLAEEGRWLVQEPVVPPLGPERDRRVLLRAKEGESVSSRVPLAEGAFVDLIWDRKAATLTLDRSSSGLVEFHPSWIPSMTARLKEDAPILDLRILLDVTSIEVFAEGGKTVLTATVFPR